MVPHLDHGVGAALRQADVDRRRAVLQRVLDQVVHHARQGDRIAIHRLTGKRAVEIDDMQVIRARIGEQRRLMRGIVAINGGAIHIAFRQADDLPALQVDCGEDGQGRHSRNLSSSANP